MELTLVRSHLSYILETDSPCMAPGLRLRQLAAALHPFLQNRHAVEPLTAIDEDRQNKGD